MSTQIKATETWALAYSGTAHGAAKIIAQVTYGVTAYYQVGASAPTDTSGASVLDATLTEITVTGAQNLYVRALARYADITMIGDNTAVAAGNQPSSAMTDKSGTITSGGNAQTAIAANTARVGYSIQNTSTGELWFSGVGTAAVGGSSMRLLPGGYYESPANAKTTAAISIYGATTGQSFAAREW